MSEDVLKVIGNKIQNISRLFPRIEKKIIELWGSDGFDAYISSLVVSDREDRQGFPPEVAMELMTLSFLHDKYMNAEAQEENPWAFEKEMGADELAHFKTDLRAQGMDFAPASLFDVVKNGNAGLAREFVRAGMDVDTRRQDQWTPLMVALFHKQEDTALMLIGCGANVKAVAERGYQPIHWAALSNYLKVTELILKKGASVNAATEFGWTPLMQAATKGSAEMAKLLIGAKASVNMVEHQGFSALHKACANEHLEIVKALLAAGADPNLRATDGTTPLALASKKGNQDIISLLRAFGGRD